MSYVRWSSKVRDGCKTCGDPDWLERVQSSAPLCHDCASDWYIYWDCDGYIAIHHTGGESWQLAFEDAEDWQPPEDFKQRDVALAAVAEAVADWKQEEGGAK